MLETSLGDLLDRLPEFVGQVGLGLLRLIERATPSVADALEPHAALIGWGMFGVAGIVIVMCVAGLFSRR